MGDCLFCKIINGDIPSFKVYEDDKVFCFLDITPVNEGHTLVVPKNHSVDLSEMSNDDVNHSFQVARDLGKKMIDKLGVDGFNVLVNSKPASGQIIFHTHIHVIPRIEGDGFKHWSGKSYEQGKAETILRRLLE